MGKKEKVTVLVKGDIYCKECGCVTCDDNAIAKVDPNDYPNPSLIIEGDLVMDNFVYLDDRIRLVATGLIHMRGLGITPSVMTCDGSSHFSVEHISAEGESTSWGQTFDGTKELHEAGNTQAKEVKLKVKGDKLYVHGNLCIPNDFDYSKHDTAIRCSINNEVSNKWDSYQFLQVDTDFITHFKEIHVDGVMRFYGVEKEG